MIITRQDLRLHLTQSCLVINKEIEAAKGKAPNSELPARNPEVESEP